MIRTTLFVVALALVLEPASAQTARQVKSGELVRVSDGLTVKVTTGAKTPFAKVKLAGAPFVVVVELDAGKNETALSYKLTADAKSSDLYLTVGTKKLVPRAVMEDFPSWGGDNDKEVEAVDPRDDGAVSLSFKRAGSISLLFDVPADQASAPKKLSILVRTVKPAEAEHSFVVTL